MTKAISETERARRQQLVINSRAALALGVSLEACLAARKAAIEQWTAIIRGQMSEHGVSDPVAVLPEILARLEEHAIGEARTAAKAAAREEFRALLRKAIA
jgi:hypothetical protein